MRVLFPAIEKMTEDMLEERMKDIKGKNPEEYEKMRKSMRKFLQNM